MPIPRIPQYPNPPGSPTLYPERAENDLILGLLVSPGYFFVTLVLLIGLALGDTSAYGVNHFLIIDGEVFIRTLSYLTYLDPFPDIRIFNFSDLPFQHFWLPASRERRHSGDRCC